MGFLIAVGVAMIAVAWASIGILRNVKKDLEK